MRTRHAAVGITTALFIALTGCFSGGDEAGPTPADPTKLDDAAELACDDFAKGYDSAQTEQARVDLAGKVNKWAQDSVTNLIAENATAMARGSEAGPDAWKMGADAFAQACLDAGWKA
ncbi:hypothetical protein ACGFMO_15410 [Streptomyces niveus]|jgi:hypothetical protein|uniref:hypothetical protein n=1 Tax=Streptomyces niveus TaxID=193462 RepID=UPI003713B1C7